MATVHTGARPGRPATLICTCAGILVGVLGLAWVQVRDARALGPRQPVPNTPLTVRLPRDWVRSMRDPQSFVLPAGDEERSDEAPVVRRIRLGYEPNLPFHSPAELIRIFLRGAAPSAPPRAAKIGAFDAFEVTVDSQIRFGRKLLHRQRVLRIATLPRGEVILAEYTPLLEMQPPDVDLFDDVCRSVELEQPHEAAAPAEILARAGLSFPAGPHVRLAGPDEPLAPAVFASTCADGIPVWSLAIHRTWLAGGRRPADLLADFAAEFWLRGDARDALRTYRRPDGGEVCGLSYSALGGDPDGNHSPIASAWVVARSPAEVVIIYVYADASMAEQADADAARVADRIEVRPLAALPDLDRAEAAGRAIAAKLADKGAAPRWGRERVRTYYRGRTSRGEENLLMERAALDRNPSRGYEGRSLTRSQGPDEQERWTIDGRAQTYTRQAEFSHGSMPIEVFETRRAPDGEVTRAIRVAGRHRATSTFEPGPAFVCPPAEQVVEGWVARGEPPAAIIQSSAILGAGTHSMLLQQLPPDGKWTRVLVQADYWPAGSIHAHDDTSGEYVYVASRLARWERVEERAPDRAVDRAAR